MESIAISELRANLMKVLKEIKQGANINITSRGKVIAKLVPPDNSTEEARDKLSALSQTALIGDILSSTETHWNEDR